MHCDPMWGLGRNGAFSVGTKVKWLLTAKHRVVNPMGTPQNDCAREAHVVFADRYPMQNDLMRVERTQCISNEAIQNRRWFYCSWEPSFVSRQTAPTTAQLLRTAETALHCPYTCNVDVSRPVAVHVAEGSNAAIMGLRTIRSLLCRPRIPTQFEARLVHRMQDVPDRCLTHGRAPSEGSSIDRLRAVWPAPAGGPRDAVSEQTSEQTVLSPTFLLPCDTEQALSSTCDAEQETSINLEVDKASVPEKARQARKRNNDAQVKASVQWPQ
jgi:hypothetical protein